MRVESLGNAFRNVTYDLFVGAVGYEARSRFIADGVKATRGIGVAFPYNQVLDFDENRRLFVGRGFAEVTLEDDDVFQGISDTLVAADARRTTLQVAIDVSSFSRRRTADVLAAAIDTLAPGSRIDILYAPAQYSEPVIGLGTYEVGPASPRLAGWFAEPERPLSLILGVGYEIGAALGAKEFLDPRQWWIFEPDSINEDYRAAVRAANEGLWEEAYAHGQVLTYAIASPVQTYVTLDSLVSKLSESSRVIIVPLGPKIFAISAILIGLGRSDVTVWRVTEGRGAAPVQRIPTGAVIGVSVRL